MSNNYCKSCGQSEFSHFDNWKSDLMDNVLPRSASLSRNSSKLNQILATLFTITGLGSWRNDYKMEDLQLRSWCFFEEIKNRGAQCYAFSSFFGYTGLCKIVINNKAFYFDGYPLAEFLSMYDSSLVDNKERAKQHCAKGSFPIAEGKAFSFLKKKTALEYGIDLGFPLVVKPRGGSISRHVTLNITSKEQLRSAIDYALEYSPYFIIEKFLPNTQVYRATVVDFDFVVVCREIAANVVGDGISTIRELIDKKNSDTNRGEPSQNQFTLYKLITNETTTELLDAKGYDYYSIPEENEIVYLQKDPFLKLGGDLVEVTPDVHPENNKLFSDLSKHFDIRVTGIDFLCEDISRSWKEQSCAILELNSLPCIEMHHYPYSGTPTYPAKAVADMFEKYYL